MSSAKNPFEKRQIKGQKRENPKRVKRSENIALQKQLKVVVIIFCSFVFVGFGENAAKIINNTLFTDEQVQESFNQYLFKNALYAKWTLENYVFYPHIKTPDL